MTETFSSELVELIAAAAEQPTRARLSAIVFDGRKIWFKRYDAERRLFGKWLHARISPLLYPVFLRSSPWLSPFEQAARECRKLKAFSAAGFHVPQVLYKGRAVMAMSDGGESLYAALRRLSDSADHTAHDALLIDLARMLGEIHAAGLCHGRPHPRDFVLHEGKLGVLDFEEEPEAAMPLASAQARDVWLLFFHLPNQAILPHTARVALDAYLSVAPPNSELELSRMARFFLRLTPLGNAIGKVHLGGDLDRFLQAMQFFRASVLLQGTSQRSL